MKFIKSIDDFNSINEELSLKGIWKDYKGYLITIGLIASISNYTNIKATLGYNLNQEEISMIVNDIKYEPKGENKELIDKIREDLILYVNYNNKIESSKKKSLVKDIKDIKISLVPNRFADAIGREDVIGVHFVYLDYPTTSIKNAIVLNSDFFNDGIFFDSNNEVKATTAIHELFHFIDFKLNKADKLGYYSDSIDLSTLLDMDIVTGNGVGNKKLDVKIKKFLKLQGSDETDKVRHKQITNAISNREYFTNPAEIFARFHNMKMWMYKEGIISSPNANIDKKDIIYMLVNYDIIDITNKQEIDFFELLFYMKIDFDEDSENDKDSLKGFNSIVANYRDFDKEKRDV